MWVDIRAEPVPPLPDHDAALLGAKLDAGRHVTGALPQGFFLRSLVLTPDGATMLNPQADTVDASVANFRAHGFFSYAQVYPRDYEPMLEEALRRFEAR